MSFGDYYKVGLRIGAEMEPEDPYATPTTPSKGAGPSWWTLQQYRDKAWAWWQSTSKTAPMIIMIKSNGVKLHSEPHDTPEEAHASWLVAQSNPADYAYMALLLPGDASVMADHMFVPVTPLIHETVKTVTKTVEAPSGHAVAAGLGIFGAIGLLALAAKAR